MNVYRNEETEQLRRRVEELEKENAVLKAELQQMKDDNPGGYRPCDHPDCNCHIPGYVPRCIP